MVFRFMRHFGIMSSDREAEGNGHCNPSEVADVDTEKSQAPENPEDGDKREDVESTNEKDSLEKPKIHEPRLKYAYEEDQWSPLNRDGKKIYDGEFLHSLRNDPSSNIRPENLPTVDVVLMHEAADVDAEKSQAPENPEDRDKREDVESTNEKDSLEKPKIHDPSLEYVCKEDQWSPLNRDGKKIYDGEFLHELRNDPVSNIRPENLPIVDVVLMHEAADVDAEKSQAPENPEDGDKREDVETTNEKDSLEKPKIHDPSLEYVCKEDQWSPLNRDGKKIYDGEFLHSLRNDPSSNIRPENLPTVDVVLMHEAADVDAEKSQAPENPEDGDKRGDVESTNVKDSLKKPKIHDPRLKYAYEEDQWSPLNRDGKKIYDGKFLHELRDDPLSNIRPENLPTVNIVLIKRRICKKKNSTVDDKLLPDKNDSLSNSMEAPNKISELQPVNVNGDNIKLKSLFDELRQVMTILMPNNLDLIISALKMLDIESEEKLLGLVDLIHEQAVEQISLAAEYALICKELATIKVKQKESAVNFSKLIMTRCVTEFAKAVYENVKIIDGSKGASYTTEETKRRNRSFNLIRFMGELYKHGMVTTFVMHKCLRYLLTKSDQNSLKCLYELLGSIGKHLESKDQNLDVYFQQITNIVESKAPSSDDVSEVHLMLQEIIELRKNKWILKEADGKQKISDPIQNGAETKSSDKHSLPVEPSKLQSDNSIESIGTPKCGTLSIRRLDTQNPAKPKKVSKLKTKSSQPDENSGLPLLRATDTASTTCNSPDNNSLSGSNRSKNGSTKRLAKKSAAILDDYLTDPSVDTRLQTAACRVRENFDESTFPNFVRVTLSGVVNRSATARKEVSLLMTHLISTNILPANLYLSSLADVLKASEVVVIDVIKIWTSFAELIWYPLAQGTHELSELKTTIAPLKDSGFASTLMGELMITLLREKGQQWVKDKWDESGLVWSDFLQRDESVDAFVRKYDLQFILGESSSSSSRSNEQPSMEQIHEQLLCLMSSEKESAIDDICEWIATNVGERVSEPEFIRVLLTAILEASNEPYHDSWRFRVERFQILRVLISRYIDSSINLSELQCLLAIQEYMHQLECPQRLLLQILEKQIYESILSYDVFHTWETEKTTEPLTAKSVAMKAVKSFFTSLRESKQSSGPEKNPEP